MEKLWKYSDKIFYGLLKRRGEGCFNLDNDEKAKVKDTFIDGMSEDDKLSLYEFVEQFGNSSKQD
ncbi:hypothetical protein C1646_760536 [Rhizophagus diaphanus]|nr:hypothetical protein C1646_760536 [Rhizophagus diaphanus] [Rhizophagus sp. MUCL 43196]